MLRITVTGFPGGGGLHYIADALMVLLVIDYSQLNFSSLQIILSMKVRYFIQVFTSEGTNSSSKYSQLLG